MPKTVAHIVRTHELASKRRATGRPIWDQKIPIKQLLTNDDALTPEAAISIAKNIALTLRQKVPAFHFDCSHEDCDLDFLEAVEELEQVSLKSLEIDLQNNVDPTDFINHCLEAIYDWADINRFWID